MHARRTRVHEQIGTLARWTCRHGLQATATFPAAVALWLIGCPPQANAADLLMQNLVAHVKEQDNAVHDETATIDIHRTDASGADQVSTHRLLFKNFGGEKGLLGKALVVTLTPLEKRGEAFLLWQMEDAQASQAWLYLPELRQVRRVAIAGHAEHEHGHTPDANLNLGFEQLGTRLVSAQGVLIGRETLEGIPCLIVEDRAAADPDLLPLRRFWVSSTDWTIGKIEYRTADGRLARTQRITWDHINGVWVWKRTEITPADGSGRTVVEVHDVALNTGLADRLFTVETLKSGRVP